jgi:hypothetical protein
VVSELVPSTPHDPASELVGWADAARAANALARSLVGTQVVPSHFRGKPEEATAAILLGAELGLSPIASLRSFYPTRDGALGLHAAMMLALVQSRGHRVWTVEADEDHAVVAGARRDDPEHVETAAWDLTRAGRLGLLRASRSGAPTSWQTQPGIMLRARATTEICRRIASDVLLGVPEADDELGGGPTRPVGGSVTVQRRPVAVPERPDDSRPVQTISEPRWTRPEPAAEPTLTEPDRPPGPRGPEPSDDGPAYGDDDEPPEPEDAEPTITEAQRARVMAGFSAMGIRSHEARMEYIGKLFGKAFGSTNELKVTEASELINCLERRLIP